MKKTFAFVLFMLLNTHLQAWDFTYKFEFPETCIDRSCFDKETIEKNREQYDKDLKENYFINNARPNELNNNTRKRLPWQLQHFLYYV